MDKEQLTKLKPMPALNFETAFEKEQRRKQDPASMEQDRINDSIQRVYCAERLAKYNLELKREKDYEDSLVNIVNKFNVMEREYDYYLRVRFPSHCTSTRYVECDFSELDFSEKAEIVKVFKFGNKDGSSGTTIYKRQ